MENGTALDDKLLLLYRTLFEEDCKNRPENRISSELVRMGSELWPKLWYCSNTGLEPNVDDSALTMENVGQGNAAVNRT